MWRAQGERLKQHVIVIVRYTRVSLLLGMKYSPKTPEFQNAEIMTLQQGTRRLGIHRNIDKITRSA